jgi:hypothetical protein
MNYFRGLAIILFVVKIVLFINAWKIKGIN